MRDRLDQVKAGVIEEMAQHYQWTAEEREHDTLKH